MQQEKHRKNDMDRAALGQILLDARNGNQKASERLFDEYEPLLSSLVYQYRTHSMSEQDAEDMKQEARLHFWNAVQKFDIEQSNVSFGLFAKTCMTNGIISYLRTLSRRVPVGEFEEDAETKIGASSDSPADEIAREEQARILQDTVRLTLTDFEYAVWSEYILGKPAKKIAQSVGVEEKSVTNAIYRAKGKLRAVFDSH